MKPGSPFFATSFSLLLSIAPQVGHAADDPRVAALISRSGAALHVEALHSVHIIHATGKVVASGLSGSGDDWNEMGGVRAAAYFSTPPLGGGSGWDGDEDWNLDQTGLVAADGSVLGRSTAIDEAYVGDYGLWTPAYGGATVTWGGSKQEQGKSYDLLTVLPPKSSLPIDIWFDQATHLPVQAVQAAGPVTTTITMADFRPVGGLMVPYRVDTDSSVGSSSSFTATSVEADPAGAAGHLAAPTSSPHDFAIAGGATQAVVPIQVADNHVYLDVMLDGKGPFHFIFDSGGVNIIDPGVAKELGLASGGSTQVGGTGSGTVDTSFAVVKSLRIGAAEVQDQVFAVLPVAAAFSMTSGRPVVGVIGFEVLSRFVTTFDYAGKQVVLHMPGSYTPPAGATSVPFVHVMLNSGEPQFACSFGGAPSVCTLDIGASQAVSFFTPFAKAHPDVVPAKLTAEGIDGFGIGGPSTGRLGRLPAFSFGGLTIHDLVADYTTEGAGALGLPFFGANVGGAVWKRFTLTLDYQRLTMTLTPNAEFSVRDFWERGGLYLIDKGAITIMGVRPGTPAAKAGLEQGDIILSLDGAANPSLRAVRDAVRAAPGTVVHLVIKSKTGGTRDVTLTLADYV